MHRAVNLAQEGWMGCPHCGRGVNGRYLFLDSNIRLLRRLDDLLREANLATPQVLALLQDIYSDLAVEADAEQAESYPEICFDHCHDDEPAPKEDTEPREAKPTITAR